MINLKNITGLVIVLLTSMLVSSCGSSKEKSDNAANKQSVGKQKQTAAKQKQPEAEQKKLSEEQKKLAEEQEQLIDNFVKKSGLPPKKTQDLKEKIAITADTKTKEAIDISIEYIKIMNKLKEFTDEQESQILEQVNQVLKKEKAEGLNNFKDALKHMDKIVIDLINIFFKMNDEELKKLSDHQKETILVFLDKLFENLKKQIILKEANQTS